MNTYKPFSADRLCHIRRLRKARRLFSQSPLFAFQWMSQQYQGYTYEDFLDDLRPRSKKKKRKGKCPLVRYGRYGTMQRLLSRYAQTREQPLAIRAMQLRRMMTKPYRVLARFRDFQMEYTLSPLLPMECIVELVAELRSCTNEAQATTLVEACRARHRAGG